MLHFVKAVSCLSHSALQNDCGIHMESPEGTGTSRETIDSLRDMETTY